MKIFCNLLDGPPKRRRRQAVTVAAVRARKNFPSLQVAVAMSHERKNAPAPTTEGVVHMVGVGDVGYHQSHFAGAKGRSAAAEGFEVKITALLVDAHGCVCVCVCARE
jgi:hypothetical protein